MNGTIVIIPPEGEIVTQTLTATPSLETLQAHVGGWLELLPRWSMHAGKHACAFCNEEGLLKNLPVNERATLMWEAQNDAVPLPTLRGTVIVLSGDYAFMVSL